MKEKYIAFITQYHIEDVLSSVEDLSFTTKIDLLCFLTDVFEIDVVNMALRDYYISYIEAKRNNNLSIKNILIGLCRKYASNR